MLLKHNPRFAEKGYYKWLVLVIAVTASFMAILDVNIVVVALPKMMAVFGVNVVTIDWVMISFTVTYSIVILLTIYASRKFGLKIPFIISIILFTIGSVLCGIAPTYRMLVLSRILQGIGGAGLIPISLNLIARYFRKEERGAAMGIWNIGIMVAPAIGPMLGGYFVDYVDWRWIFYFNVPVGIILIIASVILMEKDIPATLFKKKFDFIGFLFISIFLGTLLYVLNEGQTLEWNSRIIRINELIGVSSLILFALYEIFTTRHLIDYSLFKNNNFIAGNIVSVIRAAGVFSTLFLLPIFIENILNYNAMRAGFLMVPFAVAVAISSPIVGKLSDKLGPRYFLVLGMIFFAVSNFMLGDISLRTSIHFIIYDQFLRGLGIGFINAPVMMAVINSAPKPEQVPDASAMYNVIFQVGASFGVAFSGEELSVRQVFHLGQYARDVNYYFYPFRHFAGVLFSGLSKKSDAAFRYFGSPNPLRMFDYFINSRAEIAAYGDVFYLMGYVFIAGAVAALFIKNTSGKK